MIRNSGSARAKSSAVPPAMIVSVPSWAFGDEPVTGASSSVRPLAASSLPIARVCAGEIVDMSTHSVPAAAPRATPSSPSSISRTWSPSTTMLMTMSLAAPTAAGVGARRHRARPSRRSPSRSCD